MPPADWESAGDEPKDNFEKDCNDSRGDGVWTLAEEGCGISTARLRGLFVGRARSNTVEVGEKASKAERFPRERSGESASISISGEY
jgi:hypothetical protein